MEAENSAVSAVPIGPFESAARRLYSPLQVAGAAWLGGPFAAVHLIRANFKVLGDERRARATLKLGIPIAVGFITLALLILLVPHNPGSSPSTLIHLACGASADWYVRSKQKTKAAIAESPEFSFQSNWRTFFVGIGWSVASIVLVLIGIFVLVSLGVLQLPEA